MPRVKAPEERKTIAHGASRGKNGDFFKPRHGAKGRVPPSFAPPGLPCVRFRSHGSRRGLLSFALTGCTSALRSMAWRYVFTA